MDRLLSDHSVGSSIALVSRFGNFFPSLLQADSPRAKSRRKRYG